MIEKDPNPFPTIDLFPRITRVARAIGSFFVLHQLSPVSEHFQNGTPERDEQLVLPFNPNGGPLNDPRDIARDGEW